MRKLTEEEKQIVIDNHNLIYGFCRDKKLDVDEWYGFVAEQLCIAVINHNEGMSKLSTFFYTIAGNALKNEYRRMNTLKSMKNTIAYDETYCNISKDSIVGIDSVDSIDAIIAIESIKSTHELMPDIVDLILDTGGTLTIKEISDILGIEYRTLISIISNSKKKYMSEKKTIKYSCLSRSIKT